MNASSNIPSFESNSKTTFWKKNNHVVPGRPSQKDPQRSESNRVRLSGSTSFQDFQESVSDAWDLEDDDDLSIIPDTKISKRVSHNAALNVIRTHKKSLIPSNAQISASIVHETAIQDKCTTKLSDSCESSTNPPNTSTIDKILKKTNQAYPGRPQPFRCSVFTSKDQTCQSKLNKFTPLLDSNLLNLSELRQLGWSGIPAKVRAITWRLLSGYLPASLERRQAVLERKRLDYWNLVQQYYDTERDEAYQDTYRRWIHIDVPRMNPMIALFQQSTVQEMFERILFIWAIRHPASGYVQGINDLVTPFFMVFLQEALSIGTVVENFNIENLSKEHRDIIEADSFWCLSKFLDCIQDNYIFAQLGIQTKVNQLKDLIQRVDEPLHKHLQMHGVDYLQFSFRWMNNLLTRELPLHCTIRLWDTYLAESDGFASFQLYGLMILLQNLPTQDWTDCNIGVLVAEAYRLKFTFADAPNHLQRNLNVQSDR
ncbi:TBC1 domain family member 22B-like [Ctenocephalides felis]|uniref:TBC1 domain family member 22B-like n=1 Tax=Ctenocephalides felis TaxID=7515 RepID=UPI000E6E5B44|nr:TBC1 domain family member 22B-like [Ctenocephalides felis]